MWAYLYIKTDISVKIASYVSVHMQVLPQARWQTWCPGRCFHNRVFPQFPFLCLFSRYFYLLYFRRVGSDSRILTSTSCVSSPEQQTDQRNKTANLSRHRLLKGKTKDNLCVCARRASSWACEVNRVSSASEWTLLCVFGWICGQLPGFPFAALMTEQ